MILVPTFAVVEATTLLLSVGLSIAAGYLLKKKSTSITETTPTLSTRGTFTTWLVGIRKVGPIICWVGDRYKRKEKTEGVKGIDAFGSKTSVWYESSMHVLATGPVYALHQILAGGETIMWGPITSASHPSGTTVDLGKEGSFVIYWGEDSQPVNAYLGASTRIGVSSRWPTYCYIQWINRRLGSGQTWKNHEYVIEKRPQSTLLSDTNGWTDPTKTLSGPSATIIGVNNGAQGTAYFEVAGSVTGYFKPKTFLRLTGNAIADQDLEVLKSEPVITNIGGFSFSVTTRIFPVGGLTGADANGSLQIYYASYDDGANPAHVIAEMLFDAWPRGLSLDQSFWDIDSLEDLGTLANTEGLRTSFISTEGQTFEAVFANALQDLGCFLAYDTSTGKLKFVPLRKPTGTLPIIKTDHEDTVPEVISDQMETFSDRLIFEFPDRRDNFKIKTFNVGDDGHAAALEHQTRQKVAISIAVNASVAESIMERRELEVLGEGSAVNLPANRGARTLIPGDPILVNSQPEVMRVSGIKIDTESGVVELNLMSDVFGTDPTDFNHGYTSPNSGIKQVEPDPAFGVVEVPEYVVGGVQRVMVPRIRAHDQVVSANIYLSRDNSTYTLFGKDDFSTAGGVLASALAADGDFMLDQGPTITVKGPDIANVIDLSSDATSWGNGRQLVVINQEIFFLKKVTALGGSSYRLDGLIRARYDTERAAHSVGDGVFIFLNDEGILIDDVLLEPSVALYAKSQPVGYGTVPLSAIAPAGLTLYGKGVRPPKCNALRVTAPEPVNAYATGNNVTLEWNYPATLAPGTGAGLQGAGTSVGTPLPPGQFRLEILTTGDVLKRTEILDDPTYTYTNANLQSDLGSEVSFKARVVQLRNGYESDAITITVEKV